MRANIRTATPGDVPRLESLIQVSARELCGVDYAPEQVEAALQSAWAVDTELILDGTYFVVEDGKDLAACGGWSERMTLFGGDAQPGRRSDPLDPAVDAARIRAFFVHPDWARSGLGRALLEHCEREARARGYSRAELVATLTGRRLYAALGYEGDERVAFPLPGGLTIDFVPMKKRLGPAGPAAPQGIRGA